MHFERFQPCQAERKTYFLRERASIKIKMQKKHCQTLQSKASELVKRACFHQAFQLSNRKTLAYKKMAYIFN